jgi:hypothetical protein
MPKNQMDYSNTIIYKLCCKDPSITDIYIGHTTNFTKRKNHHKNCCINENNKEYNRYVYDFIRNHGGWDNWTMIQIENISCKDKREAESVEQYWIEKTAAKLNSMNPFTLYKEEPQLYKQLWYEEKKDYILEKAKQYYGENKEQKLEYQKQYAEEHKEKLSDYQKQYQEQHKEQITEQKKIYREEHKAESSKAQKEWREANKDTLKEKRSEIIQCDCGHAYTFGNKNRHLHSKIHTSYKDINVIPKTEEELTIIKEEKINKQKLQQKIYRETHAEQIQNYKKQHYQQNKEEILKQNEKYKEKHNDEMLQKQKIYVQENKDKIKKYKNEWYQKNKEKCYKTT